tara:strand:+ start:952 stop:1143 length:192 start_codon:yes stop_codon:yes gene_type:complete
MTSLPSPPFKGRGWYWMGWSRYPVEEHPSQVLRTKGGGLCTSCSLKMFLVVKLTVFLNEKYTV